MVLSGVLAYSNTAQVPFLLDDSARISNNSSIRTLWPTVAMLDTNRPVVNYSFAINYAIHGYTVAGYHAVNLLIHLLAGLCLFGVARRTMGRMGGVLGGNSDLLALGIALIWIVHPLQTQAVTYINQRYESLMGLAYLGTLYGFIRSLDSSRPRMWRIAAIVSCAIGMGCKEAMVSAPLIVLWYDRAFVAQSWRELIVSRRNFYVGLASTWLVLAWAMLHYTDEYTGGGMISVDKVTPWTYLLSQSAVIVHYLRLSVWPQGQCFWDQWPIAHSVYDVWPQFVGITSIAFVTILCIFRSPKLSFLGGWFLLILAPTSSFVPIKDLIFEQRMYLPLAAVCVAFVLGLYGMLSRCGLPLIFVKGIHSIVCCAVVIALAFVTFQRNGVYHSEISIWQDTIAKSPHHAEAWNNLASAFVSAGRPADALKNFEKANRLAPDNANINSNYGAALLEDGQLILAREHLESAIGHDPKNFLALQNLGNLSLDMGDSKAAIDYCERSIALAPKNNELRMTLASAYFGEGRIDDAIEQCKKALELDPNYSTAHYNLMSAYSQTGKLDEAIRHGESAVRAEPKDAMAQGTLGMLLADKKPSEAIEHLQIACELDPSIFEFQFTLKKLLAKYPPNETK